jgi:large subunit ribosomal protein L10
MLRTDKETVVADIQKLFADNPTYFITDYQGLNVAEMTTLRRDLTAGRVRYLVAKNSLLKLGAHGAGISNLDEHLVGPTAIAFTADDPASAAKILYESFKKRELPRIKAFVVDQQMFGADEIKRLADLPSREVLLAQLVAAIESPLTSLVGSLDGLARELVGTLDALAEKKKAEK